MHSWHCPQCNVSDEGTEEPLNPVPNIAIDQKNDERSEEQQPPIDTEIERAYEYNKRSEDRDGFWPTEEQRDELMSGAPAPVNTEQQGEIKELNIRVNQLLKEVEQLKVARQIVRDTLHRRDNDLKSMAHAHRRTRDELELAQRHRKETENHGCIPSPSESQATIDKLKEDIVGLRHLCEKRAEALNEYEQAKPQEETDLVRYGALPNGARFSFEGYTYRKSFYRAVAQSSMDQESKHLSDSTMVKRLR